MAGALLDSHALYWLVRGEALTDEAFVTIGENQESGTLFVSPITAWELTLASRKPAHRNPPDLGGGTPSAWFSSAVKAVGAKIIPIRSKIALEAAAVIVQTGHNDPGDCYLVATARVRRIPIITRDRVLIGLDRAYLDVVVC